MNEGNDNVNDRSVDNSMEDYNNLKKDTNDKDDSQFEESCNTYSNKPKNCKIPIWVIFFLLITLALDGVCMIKLPN